MSYYNFAFCRAGALKLNIEILYKNPIKRDREKERGDHFIEKHKYIKSNPMKLIYVIIK